MLTLSPQAVFSPRSLTQDALVLRQVFQALDASSCPYSYNFHMHTVCSDGQLQPEELANQAISLGLKGFAVTDHHTTSGYRLVQAALTAWEQNHCDTAVPRLWSGIEVTSVLLGVEVHILGYAFDADHPALMPYLLRQSPGLEEAAAARVIEAIHQAGGLAVLAHPARYKRSATELIPAAASLGIDGVETYYAYTNPNPWSPSLRQTEEVLRLSSTFGLLNTCGTDTHGPNLLQRL
ncbi:phosphatase [Leptolyngbya sp. 'hensonii']|uniref:PHP domain-containing protein n=1 Tax=Leptolyngbya sp. 'hensonii' TaxID=1922337 RepID=UPI00094F673C|nr:PHP domain-containing protein [Leptolyngbya sp. 'hensonii']OLP15504.1 phosphatase [Leptolyngbya sp. 'hensonii']